MVRLVVTTGRAVGVVTSAALVLLLLLGEGAIARVVGEEVMDVVVLVVGGRVVGIVEVTAVGVEVLMVVGAMVEGAKGGGVGLNADTTEVSVNSTTREEFKKRKRVKDVKQDSTSSSKTIVTS